MHTLFCTETKRLLVIMTSTSSGYVTFGGNVSLYDSPYLHRSISVPHGVTVFVRYTETGLCFLDLTLYRDSYDKVTGRSTERASKVWNRVEDYTSDFLHVFQATTLSLFFSSGDYKTGCFKLFFSFFHPAGIPQKLPSGLWNCSASYYSSIHHHLDCNLKTECEDGRDETEHCHFSSPECQGLVVLCNQCYQFVTDLKIPFATECLSYENVCDQISHCYDETDVTNCHELSTHYIAVKYIPFPALINFDSIREFTSDPLNSTDSCPDSHYRCPGDFNDCLPVFTRCNGVYDCLDHQDEEGCEDLRCPGFFRCRVSMVCVHNDNLCDGWSHCPLHDDELLCNVACPVDCVCQGHTFLCFQPFSATLFPQIRYLDATGSGRPSAFEATGDAHTVSVHWTAWLEEFEAFADSVGLFITPDDDANKQQRRALLPYVAGKERFLERGDTLTLDNHLKLASTFEAVEQQHQRRKWTG
ncbi:hypothetical protein ACOMHN_029843 [Nucella lapillus]